MITLIDLWRFVIKYLFETKRRVFLTISGIVIGIFTFTFFLFVSQGLSGAITGQFSAFGLNVLGVQAIEDSQNAGPPGGGGLTDTDLAKIKQVARNYKYIGPAIFYSNNLYEYGREKTPIVSLSYPDDIYPYVSEDIGLEMQAGRNLRAGDSGVAVVGAKTAESAFGVNNPLKVGSSVKINGRSLRVVGIFKERGDLFVDTSLLMSFDDIKRISGQEKYTIIRVSYFEGVDLQTQKEAILEKLNPNGKEKRVTITSPQQAIEQFESIIGVLSLIIGFVSSVALLVGGINVMNTMYSSVLERINEISTMKAFGSTNEDIRNIFLLESSVLGFSGALIGFVLAYGLAEVLSYVITNFAGYNVPIEFSLVFFLEIVLVTTFVAMIFGTYPAIKAAQVDPADNLRDE